MREAETGKAGGCEDEGGVVRLDGLRGRLRGIDVGGLAGLVVVGLLDVGRFA